MSATFPARRWRVGAADAEDCDRLCRESHVHPLLARVLVRRALRDATSAQSFLQPKMTDLPDPALLPDIQPAIERVRRALRDREGILIHGDYDVDGLSGSALLHEMFRRLGREVDVYIPNRLRDGYGVRSTKLEEFKLRDIKLMITVDTGTSALEPIARARELGIDVIVTDHHEAPEQLPDAVGILNPKRPDSQYPSTALSGTGVAFQFAWALARDVCGSPRVTPELRAFLVESLALVALGTVADVMPLTGPNRVLVNEGLRALERTRHEGLRALLRVSGRASPLSPRDIGFHLAPRLNAAGRLGRGELAFQLLTARDARKACELAGTLDELNRRRREVEAAVLEDALAVIERDDLASHSALVLANRDWHAGVIGIVASRLVERFHRPVFIGSTDENGLTRGSCRTIPGFALHEALQACTAHLQAHGGHAAAAGFELQEGRLEGFREAMTSFAAGRLAEVGQEQELILDGEATLDVVDEALCLQLRQLEPFGPGNPEPLFCARNLRIAGQPRRVGASGDHLAFHVRQGDAVVRAIGFGLGELAPEIQGRCFAAAFAISLNEWQGEREVQLEVKDIALDSESMELAG